jgi:hypothetical protein
MIITCITCAKKTISNINDLIINVSLIPEEKEVIETIKENNNQNLNSSILSLSSQSKLSKDLNRSKSDSQSESNSDSQYESENFEGRFSLPLINSKLNNNKNKDKISKIKNSNKNKKSNIKLNNKSKINSNRKKSSIIFEGINKDIYI